MEDNYVFDELDNLGIHELRTLARSVGVKSPTSKKRQVLLDEIRSIRAGDIKPQFNTRFGRPIKNHTNQDALLAKLFIGVDDELNEKLEFDKGHEQNILKFQQNLKEMPLSNDFEVTNVKGILRRTKENVYYFLNYNKISKKLYTIIDFADVQKYNLIEGDMVEGFAYVNLSTNFSKLTTLTQINGNPPENNIYNEDQDYILPSNIIDENGLMLGQSVLVGTNDKDSAIALIEQKTHSLNIDNVKYVVLALDISIETKLKLDRIPNITQIATTNDDRAVFQKEALIDAYNYVHSLYCHGYNVVLFVLNTLQIYDILDTAYDCKEKHSEEVRLLVSKALSQCKASPNASITVYSLYYNNQMDTYKQELNELQKIINS